MSFRSTPARWLAQLWADTGVGLRAACLAMWVAALGTTVVGLVGDRLGWWTDAQFLSNLVSSLAGALFGVPVAVIVLQRIVSAETYRRERQEAVRFAELTVQELHRSLARLTPEPDALPQLTEQLRMLTDELLPALPHRRYGPELERVLAAWQRARQLHPRALTDPDHAVRLLHEAQSQWQFLRGHVEPRLRRYDAGSTAPPDTELVGRLISATLARFGGSTGPDEEFAAAADRAVTDGSLAPLMDLYDVDDDAAITVIEEHIEELAASARATVHLLAAAAELGERYRRAGLAAA